MTGNLFMLPIAILALVALAAAFAAAVNAAPANRYASLRLQRHLEGATDAEFDAEITLRTVAAEFRRRVSLAVLEQPSESEAIIRELAKEEALLFAAVDKGLAKTFLEWVEGAGLSEILHPIAAKAAWKAAMGGEAGGNGGAVAAGLNVR